MTLKTAYKITFQITKRIAESSGVWGGIKGPSERFPKRHRPQLSSLCHGVDRGGGGGVLGYSHVQLK